MPWVLGIFAIVVAVLLYRLLGHGSAHTVLELQQGKLKALRGSVKTGTRHRAEDLLKGARVQRGRLSICPGPRVVFSSEIPPELHQQLRNVLLND